MTTINAMRDENAMVKVQAEEGGPIFELPERGLWKRTIIDDNEREFTFATEYRQTEHGPIIHRSANVRLKKPAVFAESAVGGVGG